MSDLEFSQYDKPIIKEEKKEIKKTINFQDFPEEKKQTISAQQQIMIDRFTKDEPITIPMTGNENPSHLSLILAPNLRELELMIRGLEYVKRYNPIYQREEIILRKIPDHPLNELGINTIMSELKVYTSPEIKLGRKRERDYYLSVRHVSRSIVRLVYKNLKNFGMLTQSQQRNAKRFCNAIIEIVDAGYSRSISGRENDASRPTDFSVIGNVDNVTDPTRLISPKAKENMKN